MSQIFRDLARKKLISNLVKNALEDGTVYLFGSIYGFLRDLDVLPGSTPRRIRRKYLALARRQRLSPKDRHSQYKVNKYLHKYQGPSRLRLELQPEDILTI